MALSTFQYQFNGLTFGANTAFEVSKVIGLFQLPEVRASEQPRPRAHGELQGLDLLKGRDVQIEMQVQASPGYSTVYAALMDLAKATAPIIPAPGTSGELPLFFQLPGQDEMCVFVRIRKKDVPLDVPFAVGALADAALQFHATDPRIYDATLNSVPIALPTPAPGLVFPLTFNLSFGGMGATTAMQANNAGNIDTPPTFVITGPCVNPRVSNDTTGQVLAFTGLTLGTQDTLTLYADSEAVVFNNTANRANDLTSGSTWWTLPPGFTQISFHSDDAAPTGAQLTTQWRSAWIL